MKILRIIARLNIGGPAQNAVFLSDGLNSARFETLLVTGLPTDDEGDMSFLLEGKQIRYVVIPELTRRINLFKDFVAFCKLLSLTIKEKPDIIHTHTAKAGVLGRIAGLLYNLYLRSSALHLRESALLVHTFHGHILEGYFGRLKTSLFLFIERFLARFTDRIVAVSASVRQDLLKFCIGTEDKIVVIPLGLELERFLAYNPQSIIHNPQPRIGIVGRLVPIKNHRMFLDVAKLLSTFYSLLSTKFIVVGDGECRNTLEGYAKELGITEEVTFTGWQKDLTKIYADLDVVCLTSLNEGTPVSLIEAMACGKPVVTTDVGGVRDLVTSHPTHAVAWVPQVTSYMVCERGILVKSGDIEGFAEAIKLLLENSGMRDKIVEEARGFVRRNFTKERLINDMEELYIKLCQGF